MGIVPKFNVLLEHFWMNAANRIDYMGFFGAGEPFFRQNNQSILVTTQILQRKKTHKMILLQ